MMDSGEFSCELFSTTCNSLSLTRLAASADQDSDLKEISRFPIDSPGPPQFTILSPTISRLDHQEVVETEEVLASGVDSGESGFSTESMDLFSFELDSNGIIRDLKSFPDTPADIDWFDLIDTSSTSCDLDDIRLSPVPRAPSKTVPIQPSLTSSQINRPTNIRSPTISSPVPSRIFSPNTKPHLRQGRKSIQPPPSLGNSDKEYEDGEGSSADDNSDYDIHSMLAIRPRASSSSLRSSDRYLHNEDLINGRPGQRLQLSAEENRMLQAMGVRMPSRFPLSRTEERALRTVRRKIRNKLSAQASRARRQEYVADLECRVKLTDQENQRLRRQVANLQNDKRDLITHVRRLRSYVSKFLYKDDNFTPLPLFVRSNNERRSAKAAAQAAGGTSLLIVTFMILGWTALMPLSPAKNGSTPAVTGSHTGGFLSFFPGRSRSLLESNSPDERILPDSKVTHSIDIHENRMSSVPKAFLEVSEIRKAANKINRVSFKEAPKEPHELSDPSPLGNHSDHTDRVSNEEEPFDPVIDRDPPNEFSLTSSVMNFPTSMDL